MAARTRGPAATAERLSERESSSKLELFCEVSHFQARKTPLVMKVISPSPPKPAPNALESLTFLGLKSDSGTVSFSAQGASLRRGMSLRSSETFLEKFFG